MAKLCLRVAKYVVCTQHFDVTELAVVVFGCLAFSGGGLMWYVIQVLTGQEEKACDLIKLTVGDALLKDGRPLLKECFVPRYQVERKFHGSYKKLTRTLFPGYVIAVTSCVGELNRYVRKAPTFTKLLGSSEKKFIPLDRAEMSLINAFTTEKHRVVRLSKAVAEGDSVKVVEGPLFGLEGCITQINRRKGTARVSTTMFGRLMSVEIGLVVVTKHDRTE